MAEISKQALKVDNNQSFPNNNNGAITPSILRAFNENMIDSMVDEIGYNVDSASWNQQIDSLENFTASLSTAFVSTASFNAYTSSTDGRLNNIESTTASLLIETQNLELFSASVLTSLSNLNTATASLNTSASLALVTASFNTGTRNLTFTKGDTQTFSVNIPDVSGSAGNFVTTSSFNAYTQSNDQRVSSLESNSASVNISVAALNTYTTSVNTFITSSEMRLDLIEDFTQSAQISINNLNAATSSYITSAQTSSMSVLSASFAISSSHAELADLATEATNAIYSQNTIVTGKNLEATQIIKGTPLYFTGSGTAGNIVGVYRADAGNPSRMPAGGVAGEAINTGNEGIILLDGFINGVDTSTFASGDEVFVGVGGGYTNVAPTGSALIQHLGNVEKSAVNGSGVIQMMGEARALPNIQQGYAWVGDVNGVPQPIATSSFSGGGTINTGSFATTGSNIFYGDQILTASAGFYYSNSTATKLRLGNSDNGSNFDFRVTGSGVEQQLWLIENQGGVWGNSFFNRMYVDSNLNVNSTFTASLQEGYAWVGNASGKTSNVPTSSFGGVLPSGLLSSSVTNFTDYSQSVDTRINNIVTGTGFATTGSNTFTGNQNILGTLTASLQEGYVWAGGVGNISTLVATSSFGGGGSIDTGSFATTGSNTFTGNQTISTTGNSNLIISSSSGGQSNVLLQSPVGSNLQAFGQLKIDNNAASGGSGSIKIVVSRNDIELAADSGVAIGPVNISGNGVATGAIRLLAHSGSLILSNDSFTNSTSSLSHLSSSFNTTLANFIFKANNEIGSTIISGSGNIFTNPGTPTTDRVNYIGGSTNLFLNGQSQQLPQITGSAASVSGNRPVMNGNIINGAQSWTINQAPNPGTHTYSNNILAGTGAWTFNMLGNTGTVNVINNTGLSSTMTLNSPSRSIAQINLGESGSNSLTIQNNSIAGTLTYNGPVSSSTHTISQNAILGTVIFNAQSSSRALSVSSNYINGIVIYTDNTVFAPTLGGSNALSNTNINGTFAINNRASSSVNIANNNVNTWTLSNDFDANSITLAGSRFLGMNGNALFGVTSNNLYASGSNGATSVNRVFLNNLLAGQFISASVVGDGTSTSMIGTIGAGNGLNVVGTTLRDASNQQGAGGTIGSAFFGRYNKEGLGFNTTAQVILAVGTGTSGSTGITRKTGFLIDSGSNTFVEGTFNVSGSSSLNGDLVITGSLTASLQEGYVWVGNASGITTTVATSSFGGGGAAFPYTGNAVITGSLGISGSMFGGVIDLIVATATASVDFSAANMFTLTLPSASTHINPTNIRAGQTVNIQITQPTPGTGSVTFPSNVKFAGGNDYQATTTGSAIDMLTLVSYDGTNVLATSIKNFL